MNNFEQEIIKRAFLEELEKTANWEEIAAKFMGKFLRGAAKLAPEGEATAKFLKGNTKRLLTHAAEKFTNHGWEEGTKVFKRFAGDEFVKNKAGIVKFVDHGLEDQVSHNGKLLFKTPENTHKWFTADEASKIKGLTKVTHKDYYSSPVVKSMAKTMRNVTGLTDGISSETGAFNKVKRFGSNIFDTTKQQFRNATHRTMKVGKSGIKTGVDSFGNEYKYTRTRFGFKRKVESIIPGTNKIVTKKRLPMRVLDYSMTPVGVGATTTVLGNSVTEKKHSGEAGKLKEGVKDFFKWQTPVGMTELNIDMVKGLF